MYEIEAKIKKKTINTFVELITKLPTRYVTVKSIKSLASELCLMIDEEVDKSKEENDLFI